MSGDSSVSWTCSEDDCRGIRLRAGDRCLAHADSQDRDTELKRFAEEGTIDARRVTISAELLGRILGAAPLDEDRPNRPRLSKVNFDGATFSDQASFDHVTFGDRASFNGATFSDEASFAHATFGDWASFDGATFSDRASFAHATFGDNIAFAVVTFKDYASFAHATFGDNTSFASARFNVMLVI